MKTILVHVDRDKANAKRVDAAFSLAEIFGAHVIGCHAVPPVNIYMPSSMVPVDAGQMVPQLMKVAEENAAKLKAAFAEAAPKSEANWEWVDAIGEPIDVLMDQAPLADITVVTLAPPTPRVDDPLDLAGDLAIAGGLPVLALPSNGNIPKGGKPVMIAWNGSLEAAHAIRAALPFLKRASEVFIVEVGEDKPTTLAAADLAPYLARHGLKVTTECKEGDDEVGETLEKAAKACGAELIIMGAYGHSRLREFVFGGATRSLLHQDSIAILVSN
ncbi:MAG: universal stress protein [Sphingomonadales bacterium]|jgi:nucleotide-binding universal stress UspA family protein